jgi:hypothetical protein
MTSTERSTPTERIAAKIRGALAEEKIKRGAILPALNMPRATYQRRLAGLSPWTTEEIIVLARALNRSPAELLGDLFYELPEIQQSAKLLGMSVAELAAREMHPTGGQHTVTKPPTPAAPGPTSPPDNRPPSRPAGGLYMGVRRRANRIEVGERIEPRAA